MKGASKRLFISLPAPDHVAKALAELQERLNSALGDSAVRWSPHDQFHLTLHFLGEVEESLLPEIQQRMDAVARRIGPFELEVRGLGCFPNPENPRVIWVGLPGAPEALEELAQEAERTLAGLGSAREEKDYHPHITLGRVGSNFRRQSQLQGAIKEWREAVFGAWTVTAVDVMESRGGVTGLEHLRIGTSPLRKER